MNLEDFESRLDKLRQEDRIKRQDAIMVLAEKSLGGAELFCTGVDIEKDCIYISLSLHDEENPSLWEEDWRNFTTHLSEMLDMEVCTSVCVLRWRYIHKKNSKPISVDLNKGLFQ